MIIFAVAPKPMGPPILKSFSNTLDMARITMGKIFQNQNKAVKDEITMIKGKILKANINSSPSPSERYPKTN